MNNASCLHLSQKTPKPGDLGVATKMLNNYTKICYFWTMYQNEAHEFGVFVSEFCLNDHGKCSHVTGVNWWNFCVWLMIHRKARFEQKNTMVCLRRFFRPKGLVYSLFLGVWVLFWGILIATGMTQSERFFASRPHVFLARRFNSWLVANDPQILMVTFEK